MMHPMIAKALSGAWHPADRHKRMSLEEFAAEFGVDVATASRIRDAYLAFRMGKAASAAVFAGTVNGDPEQARTGRMGLGVAAEAMLRAAGGEVVK